MSEQTKLVLPSIPSHIHFPPLPTIEDGELEIQVFTHASYHQTPRNPAPYNIDRTRPIAPHNEKLEHVGDALIGTIVTILLHELYPMLEEGPASKLKAALVENSFFAQISRRYGFPARMIAQPSQKPSLIDQEGPVANLFEAFVAGLYMCYLKSPTDLSSACDPPSSKLGLNGFDSAVGNAGPTRRLRTHGQALDLLEQWLIPLFTPLAAWVVQEAQTQLKASVGIDDEDDQQAVGAMARLNQHFIAKENMKPIFEPVEGAPAGMWTMECRVVKKDGAVYTARATRTTKKVASTYAAWLVGQQLGWS